MESNRRSTLNLVNFENVRDGGIIETPTAYAMLVEIEPREWLTLSEERRSGVYISFLTFLRGLQFPTQFLTMTTEFDGERYFAQFVGPDAPNAPSGESTRISDSEPMSEPDESPAGEAISATDGGIATTTDAVADSPLLEYGRLAHAEWLSQTLSMANVRDRRFFVAVAVRKGENDTDDGSPFDVIRDALPISRGRTVDTEDFYLDEVWARAQRVASQLPRTQVETTILDSREAVLDVLYRVYRGHEPPISFTHGMLTRADESVLTNPRTGEDLDLDGVFEAADHQDDVDQETKSEPRPDNIGGLPYDGRVEAEYIETVDRSQILQWYVRNVGPIGSSDRYHSPGSVYFGTAAFVVSLLCAIAAVGLFLGSGPGTQSTNASWLVLRELSFGLAAGSLPLFLLSLVILLPSNWVAKLLGLVGATITGAAIVLFQDAYPDRWTTLPTDQTAVVVVVYALGVFVLVAAVALAVRSRRSILNAVDDSVDEGRYVDEYNPGLTEATDV
ncbi:DUF7139 domain-containing protein [Salinigranum marinum]|uniref:DUF7139 domain-containing protein n=1 Tax=Salinigranum marinum TaxID=1515595 RepID=UPI002989B02F|nr:hypothetical protein [Salinigranum marinum]